jgi:flagellar hook assembly protein FlgD
MCSFFSHNYSKVLNQLGQQVRIVTTKQLLTKGLHKLEWSGRNANNQLVSTGIYFIYAEIGHLVIHKKIVFSK